MPKNENNELSGCSRLRMVLNVLSSLLSVAAIAVIVYFFLSHKTVLVTNEEVYDDSVTEMCEFDHNPTQYDDGPGNLIWLGALFRHGDRTPISLLDSDPYKNFDWPEGKKMLTDVGRRRMFCYGALLRRRYQNYIENVKQRDVIAQSSCSRRCIETNQIVLAGLMPPRHGWDSKFSFSKHWSPIAVQSTEQKRGWMLAANVPCAKAEKFEKNIFNPSNFNADDWAFLERMKKATHGVVRTFQQIMTLYDSVVAEKSYFGRQFRQHEWMQQLGDTENILSKMEELYERYFTTFINTPEYLRLRAGVFLKNLAAVIEDVKLDSANPTRKLTVNTFSTHDLVISHILQALGLFKRIPTFGSGLIFELREIKSQLVLRLLYANVTNNFDIQEMKLQESPILRDKCADSYCDVSAFFDVLAAHHMLIDDIETECTR